MDDPSNAEKSTCTRVGRDRQAHPVRGQTRGWILILLVALHQKQFADAILAFMRETIPREWKNVRDIVSDNFSVTPHDNFRILE
jgi:hypothetical protein